MIMCSSCQAREWVLTVTLCAECMLNPARSGKELHYDVTGSARVVLRVWRPDSFSHWIVMLLTWKKEIYQVCSIFQIWKHQAATIAANTVSLMSIIIFFLWKQELWNLSFSQVNKKILSQLEFKAKTSTYSVCKHWCSLLHWSKSSQSQSQSCADAISFFPKIQRAYRAFFQNLWLLWWSKVTLNIFIMFKCDIIIMVKENDLFCIVLNIDQIQINSIWSLTGELCYSQSSCVYNYRGHNKARRKNNL